MAVQKDRVWLCRHLARSSGNRIHWRWRPTAIIQSSAIWFTMPETCSAFKCTERRKKDGNLSFHRFPLNDSDLLNEWVVNMKRADWYPNKYSLICSKHFTKDCYWTGYNVRPRLKDNAVPTIFVFPEHLQKTMPYRGKRRRHSWTKNDVKIRKIRNERTRRKIEEETDEQRSERLQKMRERSRQKREEETPKERQRRLDNMRQVAANRRLKEKIQKTDGAKAFRIFREIIDKEGRIRRTENMMGDNSDGRSCDLDEGTSKSGNDDVKRDCNDIGNMIKLICQSQKELDQLLSMQIRNGAITADPPKLPRVIAYKCVRRNDSETDTLRR